MKRFFIVFLILSISVCSYSQNKTEEVKFNNIIAQAVLIGEKIELLDNELKIVDDISSLNGAIVDIVGVSDSLFNQSKDICDAFWYVKIKTKDKVGIVNGRQVYKIQDSNQDTIINVNGNIIKILTTSFLGMGVGYQGELLGCSVYQPILIKDSKNNYFGLVELIKNDYSKHASSDDEYPFFELRCDDGCWDKIESVVVEGTKIILKIHRRYQEGENDIEVLLNFEKGKYTAKYISFGKIKYE